MILLASLVLAAPLTADVLVRYDRPLGKVNRLVLGSNVEASSGQGIFGDAPTPSATNGGDGLWDPVERRLVPEVAQFARDTGMSSLRYPGGCLVHGYRWKESVGPLQTRPNHQFGIDEYMKVCRELKVEPVFNVSDYACTPEEAGELAEYLNAPATDAHPWAKKRAAWGHPQPYGVRIFELGNESDHGNHDLKPSQRWTAYEYADWFVQTARRIKAVDPKAQTGALMGTGTGPDDPWNAIVLEKTKGLADFIIVHTYAVGLGTAPGPDDTPDRLMRASVASVDYFDRMLARYRKLIRGKAGRDLPLAITEYNAMFVQEQPKPYRYSLGAALFSADYVGTLMKPGSRVMVANYWHFVNGYWGMVQGPRPGEAKRPWTKMPAYFLYRLWGRHFGTELLVVDATAPRMPFEGHLGTPAADADKDSPAVERPENLIPRSGWKESEGPGTRTRIQPDGSFMATLDQMTGEQYPLLALAPAPRGSHYRLTFEARASASLKGVPVGLSLIDGRGWEPYQSGNAVEGLGDSTEWRRFELRFSARADNTGALVAWRFRPGKATVSGTVEVRGLRLVSAQPERLAAPAMVSAAASKSADGKTVYVMLTNRDATRSVATRLRLAGAKAQRGRRWTVTGPSFDATEGITETAAAVPASWVVELPPHSMTAVEVTLAGR